MASAESVELSAAIAGDSRSAGWALDSTMSGHLHEAERLFTLAGEKKLAEASAKRKLVPLAGITLRPVVARVASPGQKYLSRFLLLLEAINTRCPWCCARFSVNDLMYAGAVTAHHPPRPRALTVSAPQAGQDDGDPAPVYCRDGRDCPVARGSAPESDPVGPPRLEHAVDYQPAAGQVVDALA
jgi:hypothetical protein